MAAGKTLDQLTEMLRAEIGASTNASMGLNSRPAEYQVLRRTEEFLYNDFDWPQFVIDREKNIEGGVQYYDFTNTEIDFNRIYQAWVLDANVWRPMIYGITPEDYNVSNPEFGTMQSRPLKWQHYEVNQFEIWPVPTLDTRIKFRCIRAYKEMESGSSTCSLDANLIVLFAAAELLARNKSADAQLKLTAATTLYSKLKGQSQKKRVFIMGNPGPSPYDRPRNWTIRVPRMS